jgi:hypothetical protein
VTTIAFAWPPISRRICCRKCSTMIWDFCARFASCRLTNRAMAAFAFADSYAGSSGIDFWMFQ